jgi:hypothetical protein
MAGMTDEQKAQYLLDMERHYAQCKRIEAERRKKEAWTRKTGFNQMCYECPLLKAKCIGSKNQTWTNCLTREMHEKAAPRSGTSEKRQRHMNQKSI